eukprot:TRINITY_DN43850_c0_g1_i1.p1 TRINITY_DN43850_c0_g1~~TRINITY_DN43850_c0_g1_i1.p1  ORF type:complete len:347 (-),score=56.23 TRINITY_DN43850_c0_g1_i1:67-1107(-)
MTGILSSPNDACEILAHALEGPDCSKNTCIEEHNLITPDEKTCIGEQDFTSLDCICIETGEDDTDTEPQCAPALTTLSSRLALEIHEDPADIVRSINVSDDLKRCQEHAVDPMLVAQGLRFLVKSCPQDSRLDVLTSISEELSKVVKGERVPYRWDVLSWYVKMWWASEGIKPDSVYSQVISGSRKSWWTRITCSAALAFGDEATELALVQFLSAFAAYASEVVLLAGLEFRNIEVLLEAFAEAILDHEAQSTGRRMTSIAEFARSGGHTSVDGEIPSCKDVLQYMMMLAMQTSTEHKVVQRKKASLPMRTHADLARTAKDFGLKVDVVKHIYKSIRRHPIMASRL